MAAVATLAAAVWDKPYTEWSEKDVEKVLTDSPWAGKASLTHARDGANLGPVPDWKLIVSAQSALPVRQAMLRKALGPSAVPPDAHGALETQPARYVLAISGIPRAMQRQLAKSAQAAVLKPKGKPGIPATDASVILVDKDGKPVPAQTAPQAGAGGVQIVPVAQRGGGFGGGGFGGGAQDNSGITAMLILEFPKTVAITTADPEVELSTVIGGYNVKRTFKTKDMVFGGALAF